MNMLQLYMIIQKILVIGLYQCFYLLILELVFYEEILNLSTDSEKSFLEEIYLQRSRAQVVEQEIMTAMDNKYLSQQMVENVRKGPQIAILLYVIFLLIESVYPSILVFELIFYFYINFTFIRLNWFLKKCQYKLIDKTFVLSFISFVYAF